MTIPRLTEMAEYWKINPPLHFLVAAYLGAGQKPKQLSQDPGELQSLIGSGFDSEIPEWLKTTK